ncbi:MAG TPA: YkgJ family cysteine cluster protein, partial [Vicinamibacteria bacterium]|nr:YkgJ family cysteine cluster protein [Vicinamibacteria bacterium]
LPRGAGEAAPPAAAPMKDGPLRRALKGVARARFFFDLRLTRALRHARQGPWFELAGECRRCARCCEAPAIRAHAAVFHWPLARRLFLWWQRAVNGFELQGADPAQRTFVFRCTHFDASTRACDSYESRPGLCRDYPRALLDQPAPEFLPGCGYRARAPRAEHFLRVLDERPLSEEQKAKLRRELRLE